MKSQKWVIERFLAKLQQRRFGVRIFFFRKNGAKWVHGNHRRTNMPGVTRNQIINEDLGVSGTV